MLREICCDINVLSDTSDFESEDEVFFLVPAMFDIQVNGYNKISLDDELTVDALEKMTEDMYRDGVSQFVPTIITCDYQKMVTALINTKEFMSKHPNIIPGLHLEGPFISPAKRGIHPIEHIAKIDTRVVDTIFENADIIAYMTANLDQEVSDYLLVIPIAITKMLRDSLPVVVIWQLIFLMR